MAKAINDENTFDTVTVGKPVYGPDGRLLGYQEQQIATQLWLEQSTLADEDKNSHFRDLRPLDEVRDRLLTPKKIMAMQPAQPHNPVGEMNQGLLDLQKRMEALEAENQRLKAEGK